MAADLPVRRAGLLLILLAAGCAEPPQPQPPPPPPRQITEADLQPWLRCVVQRIEQTDDGKSDASTIAAAARGMCRPQYPLDNANDLHIAIDIVLRMRARNVSRAKADYYPAWRDCVVAQGKNVDVLANTPATLLAANLVWPCRHLYQGAPGQDIVLLSRLIEKAREQHSGGVFVGPGQTLPPVDKKY